MFKKKKKETKTPNINDYIDMTNISQNLPLHEAT